MLVVHGEIKWTGGVYTGQVTDGKFVYDTFKINNKTYVNYKQYEGPWAFASFAGGTMKNSGCSLTSVSIVLTGYGKEISPGDLRNEVNGNKESLLGLLNKHGVQGKIVANPTRDSILEQLETGRPIIANVNRTMDIYNWTLYGSFGI